jgi:UDP-N-acetyl-D-mannosaminuronic acid dehydrogenase
MRRAGTIGVAESSGEAGEPEVVIVGCGAVGLPLAAALAAAGVSVLGVDTDRARVASLAAGRSGLGEPGLDAALAASIADGRLAFAETPTRAERARAYALCVPTPAAAAGGMDAGALEHALGSVSACAAPGDLVCVRSTVSIGATRALAAACGRTDLHFAATPDRSVAGNAYAEQFSVPHIVGGLGEQAGGLAVALLGRLGKVVRVGDPETAEAVKLFANASRDARFALANQFALICERLGLDFSAVRAAGAADYPRFDLARAGPVGGPCLDKDVELLLASAGLARRDAGLLVAARRLNESLPARVAEAIVAELDARSAAPKRIAVLGLAFKGVPPTPDRRGAFACALIERLRAARADVEISVWDPVSDAPAARLAALERTPIVVLANDHPALAAGLAGELWPGAVVFDMTGALDAGAGLDVRRFGDGRHGFARAPTTAD